MSRIPSSVVCALLSVAVALPAFAAPSAAIIAKVEGETREKSESELWNQVRELKDNASSALGRISAYAGYDESSIFDFVPGISSRRKERQALVSAMQVAEGQLTDSKLVRLKTLADQLQSELSRLQLRNSELVIEGKELGDETGSMISDFFLRRRKITNEIAVRDTDSRVAQLKEDRAFVMDALRKELSANGIEGGDKQIASIFATATGQEDLQLMSAFRNVRGLATLLQSHISKSEVSPQLAKEYFALHALMLAALVNIHENQLKRIEKTYIPKIKEIFASAKKNYKDADRLLKDEANKPQAAQLTKNAQTSEATMKAGRAYIDFLKAKSAKISESKDRANRVYVTVLNSFATMNVASDLLNTMAGLNQLLDDSSALSTPELIDVSNESILREFEQITGQLRVSK